MVEAGRVDLELLGWEFGWKVEEGEEEEQPDLRLVSVFLPSLFSLDIRVWIETVGKKEGALTTIPCHLLPFFLRPSLLRPRSRQRSQPSRRS